jgi:prevent-host-death family protein
MVQVVNATEAKNRFGQYIKNAYAEETRTIVERDGIAVAAIVPISDLEQLISSEEAQENIKISQKQVKARRSLCVWMNKFHNKRSDLDLTDEDVADEVQEAINAVRSGV